FVTYVGFFSITYLYQVYLLFYIGVEGHENLKFQNFRLYENREQKIDMIMFLTGPEVKTLLYAQNSQLRT
ncbi:MAG: hypothetical protein ACKO86_21490, partial [Dolichospermum sp.]